ncbi:MAG: DNA mismatch repair protein MutS [Candidatus Kapaibacteriota bacterium]
MKETPLMKQYKEMKAKNPDAVMLFRMGDFFETFEDDAVIAARVCGITLTKRNNGDAGEVPLAGFPHHQLDTYLPKLVRAGYRVAVCEQVEDPKLAKGIVKRDVIEVVTPGIGLYDKLLDAQRNTYIASLSVHPHKSGYLVYGIAIADISTGEFQTTEISRQSLESVLELFSPAEIIVSKTLAREMDDVLSDLPFEPAITKREDWIFEIEFAKDVLLRHFNTASLKGFGIDEMTAGLMSAGACLQYVNETQKKAANQIQSISIFDHGDFMLLDHATRRNLEILSSIHDQKHGSLLSVLDHTMTPMGSRLFKRWVARPLRKKELINARLACVRILFNSPQWIAQLGEHLRSIGDLERAITKICAGKAGPRDIIALKNGLLQVPLIRDVILPLQAPLFHSIAHRLQDTSSITEKISLALREDAPAQLGAGVSFNHGYSEELDTYLEALHSGKDWIKEYQDRERESTGISSLKISSNNVFGYYIEISNTHKSRVPEDRYQRRQTLANAERYITQELKEIEQKITSADEKISLLEQNLFQELRNTIIIHTELIQTIAQAIAELDCLRSFASVSIAYRYAEPEIGEDTTLSIISGRHPVVERMLSPGNPFTPNDTTFNEVEKLHIITGPNMAGKSCYLRQVGLIVLLAQIGCFVPAESAHIGIVDRIFTRVGAQDNISAGESTFLVEMQEAANIMNNATSRSLLLLDEVGRGTATFDGISIAWAIAEHVHDITRSRMLFATHYHELTSLTEHLVHARNYKVEVKEVQDTILFTHKVIHGTSDHSFGIHVAQMAGLPPSIISRASSLLKEMEGGKQEMHVEHAEKSETNTGQMSIFEIRDDALRRSLLDLDINQLTPLQAFEHLLRLKKDAGQS